MFSAQLAATAKRITSLLIGLMTLLWGSAYAVQGVRLLLVWALWLNPEPGDLSDRILSISLDFERNMIFLVLFGVFFLVLGVIALAGALRLFMYRPWGRALTAVVAVVSLLVGWCSMGIGPPVIPDTDNVPLGVAQILYGALAIALLSLYQGEAKGIYILKLMNILLGVPTVVVCMSVLADLPFFGSSGHSAVDASSRFASVGFLGGSIAGILMAAAGFSLLSSRQKRFLIAFRLTVVAAGAQTLLAVCALLGALLGHSRMGLAEAELLVFVLPAAIVLLSFSLCGAWYLRRRALVGELTGESLPRDVLRHGGDSQ